MTEKVKEFLKPMNENILLKIEEVKKIGSIIIPDQNTEKPLRGTVINFSDGVVNPDNTVRKLRVNHGDEVLFGKYSATEVMINDEKHYIVRESDLLGVFYHAK